jgi:hypothetical protein
VIRIGTKNLLNWQVETGSHEKSIFCAFCLQYYQQGSHLLKNFNTDIFEKFK